MRLIHYYLKNQSTNKIIAVDCRLRKIEEQLEQLKTANPETQYNILYKWVSI